METEWVGRERTISLLIQSKKAECVLYLKGITLGDSYKST